MMMEQYFSYYLTFNDIIIITKVYNTRIGNTYSLLTTTFPSINSYFLLINS